MTTGAELRGESMPGEGRVVRAVIVGCGGIAGSWLKPIANFKDCEIVGLVDLKRENAERRKAEFKLDSAEVFGSLSEALGAVKPEAVFDLTVPCAHPKVTLEALRRGCHVLGEKPMAESMAEARRMARAAKKAGKIYAVIQNRRYDASIIRFRDFLKSEAIGSLHTLHADFFIGAHFGGFREEMLHVLLLDMAIHTFDQARFIGSMDPVSVYCHDWNPAGSWYRHGASATAIFEMGGGVVFTYRGSWCAEGLNTSWECEWRAIGSNGSALWNGGDSIKAQSTARREGFMSPLSDLSAPPSKPLENKAHGGVIREFLDCVKDGGRPQTSCDDNIKSLAMVHAAIKSAETGRKVKISI